MILKRKIAVITGGKRGIGKAISIELAKEGASLAICAKNEEGLDELEKELKAINPEIEVLTKKVDVRSNVEVEDFIRSIMKKYGTIDILINNAAVIKPGLLHEVNENTWDLVIDTNLKAAFLTMKHIVPIMRAHESGKIINIASVFSKNAYANFSLHCAAKFGLRGLSLAVKEEIRDYNIQLMIVNPGSVDTDSWDEIKGNYDHSRMVTPKEVASSIIFALKNSEHCTIDELDITPKNDIAIKNR